MIRWWWYSMFSSFSSSSFFSRVRVGRRRGRRRRGRRRRWSSPHVSDIIFVRKMKEFFLSFLLLISLTRGEMKKIRVFTHATKLFFVPVKPVTRCQQQQQQRPHRRSVRLPPLSRRRRRRRRRKVYKKSHPYRRREGAF